MDFGVSFEERFNRRSRFGPVLVGCDLAISAERETKDVGGWDLAELFIHLSDLLGNRCVLVRDDQDLPWLQSRRGSGATSCQEAQRRESENELVHTGLPRQ